jgi:4-hydroxy-3-methylbut-2-enyl diphosphate reductase IspH
MASICVETMKHQRVERDLDDMVVMASQTTKSVVIFGDLFFFCLKESDETIASICVETMKRQQAERDLNDKVVMGEGHHTCAASHVSTSDSLFTLAQQDALMSKS